MKVRTAGFEPALSCSRSTRNTRLSYVLLTESAQRELNPHFRHGKAAGCRYIMGAFRCAGLPKTKSTGRDSNPRDRNTGAVSSPLDDQCSVSVGPEGLEPSPGGLRVRCAAASTLIPISRRGGSRTLDLTLIRGLLSPLSYAPANRAGGTRTHTCRIKSPECCRLHHDPVLGRAYAFQPRQHRFAPLPWIVPSGSPENRTQRHVVISRVWATSPRLPQSQSGWQDSNLRSRAPRARGSAATLHPAIQSERPDLNRRSPGPRPGAIPRLRYVLPRAAPASAP